MKRAFKPCDRVEVEDEDEGPIRGSVMAPSGYRSKDEVEILLDRRLRPQSLLADRFVHVAKKNVRLLGAMDQLAEVGAMELNPYKMGDPVNLPSEKLGVLHGSIVCVNPFGEVVFDSDCGRHRYVVHHTRVRRP